MRPRLAISICSNGTCPRLRINEFRKLLGPVRDVDIPNRMQNLIVFRRHYFEI